MIILFLIEQLIIIIYIGKRVPTYKIIHRQRR